MSDYDPKVQGPAVKKAAAKLDPKGTSTADQTREVDLELQRASTLAIVASTVSSGLRPGKVKEAVAAANKALDHLLRENTRPSGMLMHAIYGAHAKFHKLGVSLEGEDGAEEVWKITQALEARYDLTKYPVEAREKAADKVGAAELDPKEHVELGVLKLRDIRSAVATSKHNIMIEGEQLYRIIEDMERAQELLLDAKVMPLIAPGQPLGVGVLAELEATEAVLGPVLDDIKKEQKWTVKRKLIQPMRSMDRISQVAGRTGTMFAKTQW